MFRIASFAGEKFNRINSILDQEYGVYKESFNLIGSSNFPFPEVLEALSHPINLNPAEGFPGKRYFPNCNNLDEIELYGEDLIRNLFDLPDTMSLSLQPHSGTQANQIVFNAILEKGDSVIFFKTDCGGHVSHSFFNQLHYTTHTYGIDADEKIDFEELETLVIEKKPKLVIAGASSYPRQIDYQKIGKICKKYGVFLLADISHSAVFVLSEHHISPVPYADFITFTTHKTTRGPRSGVIIYKNELQKKVRKSIFPVSQGAPKFNEILSKVIMAVELKNLDLRNYADKIRFFSNKFSSRAKEFGFKVYTDGSESHLCVLNFTGTEITGKQAENNLEAINIFANRNMVPNDPASPLTCSGIRFGFLTLATIDFRDNDFDKLSEIIFQQILNPDAGNKQKVIELTSGYKVIQ